jgi:NAD(P) transhydrogenase
MQPYDLIVIGSGPGGQRAAIQGTKAGKRVAVVERQASIGGVCINTGTIPSKTMREAVLHLSGFYDKNFYGTNYNSKDVCTMADLNFRVQHVVENEVGVIQSQLKRNNVTVIHGTGRFTGPHHIRVDNANGFGEFEGEYIIIATGTKPASTAATSSIAIKFSACRKFRAPSSSWAVASSASSTLACSRPSAFA